jgi:hypothetical protein
MFSRTENFFSRVRNTDRPNRRLLVDADGAALVYHIFLYVIHYFSFLNQNIFLNILFYNFVIHYFPIKQEISLKNFQGISLDNIN